MSPRYTASLGRLWTKWVPCSAALLHGIERACGLSQKLTNSFNALCAGAVLASDLYFRTSRSKCNAVCETTNAADLGEALLIHGGQVASLRSTLDQFDLIEKGGTSNVVEELPE